MEVGGIHDILRTLEQSKDFYPYLTARIKIPPRPGAFSEFPKELSVKLKKALQDRGIERLYSHQASAYRMIRENTHVVVVTPTASGKTLCYNLSILDHILKDPNKRALYLFPTKALSQDQCAELTELTTALDQRLVVHTYDGDTPSDIRKLIRKKAHIVITNPDMLHSGILPNHTKWNTFFESLSYIVIDEMHVYRGVFGSHVVNVLRRLRRIYRHYGSLPLYICSSATIANPKEAAERLIEQPVCVVSENGAPQGEKSFYFFNPPMISKELGLRRSPLTSARKIAERLLKKDVSTIVFTTSRTYVEILTKYLKDVFKDNPRQKEKIRGYRGGYLPRLRREIEKGLREGRVKGVVSTNALELGVDIGTMNACILCGYPGSIASTWQQAGRAGRKEGASCAILIARSSPIDQFIVNHPDYFFNRSPEHARVNADNLLILVNHIKCAAFELPINKLEQFGHDDIVAILEYLTEKRVVHRLGDHWHWAQEAYPADQISLRSASPENFLVVDLGEGCNVVGEVDYESAPLTLYVGAIYMLETQQYQVESLDFKKRKAYVRKVRVEYYTEAVQYSHIRVLDVFDSQAVFFDSMEGPVIEEGEVQVLTHVAGFKKLKFYTLENIGYGEVALPDQEMHSTAIWIRFSQEHANEMGLSIAEMMEGIHGMGYAMQHMACFILMCEPRDLGRSVGDYQARRFVHNKVGTGGFYNREEIRGPSENQEAGFRDFQPTIFLYDAYPGGVGFSTQLFDLRNHLTKEAHSLIEKCPCDKGCPSCVGASSETGERAKRNSLRIMEWMTRRII